MPDPPATFLKTSTLLAPGSTVPYSWPHDRAGRARRRRQAGLLVVVPGSMAARWVEHRSSPVRRFRNTPNFGPR